MVRHITVVLPNKPGALAEVLETLAAANVNIWTLHLANTGRTGFVQMVCLPHEVAARSLKQKYGYYVTDADVIAISLQNRPGELLKVLKILAANNININHAYDTFDRGESITLLEPEVPWELESVRHLLKQHHVTMVDKIGE